MKFNKLELLQNRSRWLFNDTIAKQTQAQSGLHMA